MNKILSIIAFSLLFTVGRAADIHYVIEGETEGLDGKFMYLHDYDKKITFDSTLVSNGRFKFEGTYDRPAFVRVENGNYFSNCVLDTLAVVDFNTHYPTSGSSLNKKLINFIAEEQKIEDELNKFAEELRNHGFEQPELGDIFKHLYDKLYPRKVQLLSETIENNPDGIGEAAIMSLGNTWDLDPDDWDAAYSKMSQNLKDSRLANYFNTMFSHLKNSQPGKPFIDLKGKTVDGQDVSLSDYLGKGKYVLIDFWASWCGPCREEAEKTLRPLYEKYKDDDRFMILGVATWDQHDGTIAALEKLNYPWPQIIDAGETPMRLYGFNGIPMIFLIGPDGTILQRELRGEAIISAVDTLLN